MRAHFIFDARHESAKLIERKCAERPGAVYPFSVRFSARGKDYALAGKGVKSGLPDPCPSCLTSGFTLFWWRNGVISL